MQILVTGGAGYIGSHIALRLLEQNHQVVVIDNLCNSSPLALQRIEKMSDKTLHFYHADICDSSSLENIFSQYTFDAVIHLAGLKSVCDSLRHPLTYYQNNISGSLTLLQVMKLHNVRKLIFSSSATVYGIPEKNPVSESANSGKTTNPYGATKHIIEKVLHDMVTAQPTLAVTALRYFNPAGAHPSGLIGEDPLAKPTNLIPYLFQVATGQQTALPIYGNDYHTPDGTGVRDYIHVMDLAEGHLQALHHLEPGYRHYNLGTGFGYSVLEIVRRFEALTGKAIRIDQQPRRVGDVAVCLADPTLANNKLHWQAERSLDEMLVDGWRWQTKNPTGYADNEICNYASLKEITQ